MENTNNMSKKLCCQTGLNCGVPCLGDCDKEGISFQGDDGSVGLDLFSNVSEIEERARCVEQSVTEGYFNFDEALSIYKITKEEYMVYFPLKNKH